jgi:hypothetical protein
MNTMYVVVLPPSPLAWASEGLARSARRRKGRVSSIGGVDGSEIESEVLRW